MAAAAPVIATRCSAGVDKLPQTTVTGRGVTHVRAALPRLFLPIRPRSTHGAAAGRAHESASGEDIGPGADGPRRNWADGSLPALPGAWQ